MGRATFVLYAKVYCVDRKILEQTALNFKESTLGLDIAKHEIVACLRWDNSEFERPWTVVNPLEIKELVELCLYLVSLGIKLSVAMESTGTYGEGIRRALTVAEIEVIRVSGKHVSDYKEIFDGVPSQHDGKDAAMIAELASMNKGTPWPFLSLVESMEEIRFQVRRMDTFQTEHAGIPSNYRWTAFRKKSTQSATYFLILGFVNGGASPSCCSRCQVP